jgi:hypothetical protein
MSFVFPSLPRSSAKPVPPVDHSRSVLCPPANILKMPSAHHPATLNLIKYQIKNFGVVKMVKVAALI